MTVVTLPPGPTVPPLVQTAYALTVERRGMDRMRERYGNTFTVNLPPYGPALVICGPDEIKQVFLAGLEDIDNPARNLGKMLGPGSLFALDGEEHLRRRKPLVPPFNGRRLAAYEKIVEDEAVREMASWPQGRAFPTLPSMTRITMNIILRAVFGAEGAEFSELRELLPRMIKIGSWLACLPEPRLDFGRWGPWGRYAAIRREYDAIVARLIDKAERDDALAERDDILRLMLLSRYDDGTAMSHSDIADQLLTLLAAGHETTATTLAWAVERLRRHPEILRALVDEADAGGSALREATILEVERARPVIDFVGRQVKSEGYRLGQWVLPKGFTVLVSIALLHEDASVFPNPLTFDPGRFRDTRPDLYRWIPFGGGRRRCIGAAFANMEIDVVLRTMLRDFDLLPTDEPDERWHSRGITNGPAQGGRAIIRRRVPA
jgi:cytochrome P450